jgi:polygalacturonase
MPGVGLTFVSYTILLQVTAASNNVTYDTPDFIYPSDIGFYDVTKYGANGKDAADDTNAIQSAINAAIGHNGTVYFPAGTYYVNRTLYWLKGSQPVGHMRFENQNKSNTTIRLTDNAPGFQNTNCAVSINTTNWNNHCPAVLYTTSYGAVGTYYANPPYTGEAAYDNDIWDLTIDTGKGNPGAIGIDWNASNRGGD